MAASAVDLMYRVDEKLRFLPGNYLQFKPYGTGKIEVL